MKISHTRTNRSQWWFLIPITFTIWNTLYQRIYFKLKRKTQLRYSIHCKKWYSFFEAVSRHVSDTRLCSSIDRFELIRRLICHSRKKQCFVRITASRNYVRYRNLHTFVECEKQNTPRQKIHNTQGNKECMYTIEMSNRSQFLTDKAKAFA